MTDQSLIGDNSGGADIAELIAATYSPIRLADEHGALALDVQMLTEHAGRLTIVNDDVTRATAADMTNRLRELENRVDATAEAVKAPVFTAYRGVLDFFNGLNNSDTKKPGPLTRHKVRIAMLVRDDAFRVAQENQRIAREAAEKERQRAAAEVAAAAAQELANRPAVAGVLMDQAVKSEQVAQVHEDRAEGPVQELARTRSDAGTLGLRGNATFAITDILALRDSLGPLGDHFNAAHIEQAIRSWQAAMMKAQRMKQADEIVGARRALTPETPIAGTTFFIQFAGNVR
jgi:histone H3/H4